MRALRTLLSLLAVGLAACQPELAEQPKYETFAPSDLWADGASARPLVQGTVAQGALARSAAARTPPAVSAALMRRGETQYGIYCVPCHGESGAGDGAVVQRGFPAPPSYHEPRLRAAPAAHIFDVITDGWGVMYGYGDRVAPEDRWAIVAYVRALQLAELKTVAERRP